MIFLSCRCDGVIDNSVFLGTTVTGFWSCVGIIIASYFAENINCRLISTITTIFGGISGAALYWLNTHIQHLAVASVFEATLSVANTLLTSIIVNVYPTMVR